jgi:hypothetical protein
MQPAKFRLHVLTQPCKRVYLGGQSNDQTEASHFHDVGFRVPHELRHSFPVFREGMGRAFPRRYENYKRFRGLEPEHRDRLVSLYAGSLQHRDLLPHPDRQGSNSNRHTDVHPVDPLYAYPDEAGSGERHAQER